MRIDVAATLTVSSPAPATALLQIAVAAPTTEQLTVLSGGRPIEPEEFEVDGARVHRLAAARGPDDDHLLRRRGDRGCAPPRLPRRVGGGPPPQPVLPVGPARGVRHHRVRPLAPRAELVPAVADWVNRRLVYTAGASRPVDTAVDTLLLGQGVCRDYAHLTITLLRALEIPARLVAVYAPGLSPMDFHAVVEADVDGTWCVVDPTRLAPTSSLVRICSGRDAADTAFLSLFGGLARFETMTVTATTAGTLPAPDDVPFPLP